MKKLLVLLFFSFLLVNSIDRGPHRLDVIVERFQFGDYYFVFYSKGANWVEAYTICQATNSRLAVVNTPERAKFLADALSQTKVGFEDVWIGGRFVKDTWQWVPTGRSFSNNKDDFPPWLNYPTHRGKNCLSLDRKNHWDPIFVELKCHLYRPFICEESIRGSIDKFPEQANEITVDGRQYFLYHGRVTWHEALAFCKQSEARLAIIPDINIATQLAELMKRARPPFENVWIGARKEYLGWTWTATDQFLSNETQRNGFPPWRFDHPVDPMKTCVMLDHHPCLNAFHIHTFRQHRCEEAVFIEEECSLKKDFLCEIAAEEVVKQNLTDLVTVDQVKYIFFKDQLSWLEAMVVCEDMNMTLAMPETDRQWETIIYHMADMQVEFDHIWLGGRWIPDEWVWLNNHTIPLPSTHATYPPWCASPSMLLHEEDEDCLNLDRDAHNVAVIYGYNCSVAQGFVCQIDAQDLIETPLSNDEYETHDSGLTHFQAEVACRKNHSDLVIANTIALAQKVALLLPRDSLTWIGGRRIESIWRWIKTREIIPDATGKDNYPPWESLAAAIGGAVCLAMKAGYREQPLFVEKPCKNKLPYMCQFEPKELPQPDIILNLNDIKYYFYKKQVPWSTAMSICSSGSMYLINVGNMELANFLLEGMKDDVPLWTAGKQLSQGSWSWSTSGTKLPREIKLGYPPWVNGTINQNMEEGCLILDRLKELPSFAGVHCLQNHSFVCVDKIVTHNETDIQINNYTISLQDIVTSIATAKRTCLKDGKSLVDFTKLNYTNLVKLLQVENVKSLWVDVVHDQNGKWVYADSLEGFHTEIDFPEKDTLPRHDARSCLTLQMTVEEKLILKPALCSDFSRIICMMTEERTPLTPKVVHVINETVTLTAIVENSTLSHSNLVCNDLGGEIIMGPLVSTSIEFFKTTPPEYTHFWIDAYFKNDAWLWGDNTTAQLKGLPEASEVSFSNHTVNLKRECLIYNRGQDKLEAADCSGKFSTVCQQVSTTCEPKKAKDSVEWSPQKCSTEPSKAGAVCHANCPPNMNLVGPELNICSKGKWSYNSTPKCQNDKSQGKSLVNMTHRFLKEVPKSYFLFLLDIGVKKKDFLKLLQFSKNLGNTILLSDRRRVTLELYSFTSKVIDLMESNNCYFIHTIDKLMQTARLSNSLANYMGAFLAAEQEFADKDVQYHNAFIFFFAMRQDAGSMNRTVVVKRLKEKGVVFIVIAVGDEINRSQLEEIASDKDDGLQLYTFHTINALQDASNFLKSKSKIRTQDCPREGAGRFG